MISCGSFQKMKNAVCGDRSKVFTSTKNAPTVSGYVSDAAWKSLEENPDDTFIQGAEPGRSYSRKQVKDMACRFANLSASFQVAQGDVVHCMCDNSVLLAALQL
jgi:hypothetical protein